MRRRLLLTLVSTTAACALLVSPVAARWYGSLLNRPANATYGCEAALVNAPLGGVQLSPSNQTSCTYRHGGYLYSNRPTFLVPSSGRITAIRIRSGRSPARVRLTILTGSSRVDPFTGRDQPGTYTCCTARYVGRPFRPRPNAVTTKRVNVRVHNLRDKRLRLRIHSSDGVALSAEGSGTLPLFVGPNVGSYSPGTPLATGYFPRTRVGDPRVDGYTQTGIDLLLQWNFRR